MRGGTLNRLSAAAAVSLAGLLAGCTGNGSPPPLPGTAWRLSEIRDGTGAPVPVLPGTEVTAVFSADGKVTGSAGCNRYFAWYTTDGERITVTGAGSTKMFCGDPEGVMIQESRFLELLTAATSYSIDGKTLTLQGNAGQPLLVFGEGVAVRETGSPPIP